MIEDLRFVEREVLSAPLPGHPVSHKARILQMKINGQWVDVPMGGEDAKNS